MLLRKRFRKELRSALFIAAASASLGLVDDAMAVSGTWTYNGNENWSTGFPWLGGFIGNGANESAAFGVGVNILDTLVVTLDTNRTIGGLSFGDSDVVNSPAGWRLSGASALTLSAAGGPTINVNALGTGDGAGFPGTLFQRIAHIDASLIGPQGFTKQGAGTLVLSGNNTGLTGSIGLQQGIILVNHVNALGTAATVTQLTGSIAFRGDTATNFATDLVFQSDSVIGVGNAITTGAQYGSSASLVHSIDEVTINSYGVRTVNVSGSNGYGLTMGRLSLRDGIRMANQGATGSISGAGSTNGVNGLGSGTLTIGSISYSAPIAGTVEFGGVGSLAGNIVLSNGLSTTGGGSAALVYTGSRTLFVNGAIGTGGDTYVTGGTTGTVAASSYQAGVGTVIVGVGTLPSNKAVYINGGTLVLNGGALTHSVNGITMGGATLTSGAVPAFINSGSGTVALGGSVVVDDSVLFNTGTTSASVNATAGGIAGRLDLGGSNRSITVNGISTLTVDAIVSGTGGIVKSGTGALNLTNTNTFTGSIDVIDGIMGGTVKASGNALGSTGANVSLGGALRMTGIGSAGTGTVNTVTIKDSGKDTGFIVDASAGGAATLNVNIFGGRESGTRGTIKVVPVTGSLNTNEIVNLSTGAPATTNGILPAYIAVQNSGTNTGLGFASLSSNRIVAYNSYQTGDINSATTVYDLAASSTQAIGGAGKTLFAARIGGNSSITGGTLTLGNGTTGFGGLILNGGAVFSASALQANGTDELVIWSGGANTNSITSNINLTGDLTTGGSTPLSIGGSLNFNGVVRNLTVTGSTVELGGTGALSGATGVNKRGGGVLAIGGTNLTFTGPTTVIGGTLQIGTGASGDLGTSAITNNANVVVRRSDTSTFSNNISGSGDLWFNGTSTGITTLAGNLTYTGKTTVQSGTVKINAPDRLPTGTNLRVDGGATFDINGQGQTVSSLSGTGTITNNNGTLNNTQAIALSSGTFAGSLRNGAGSMSLVKNGSGLLVLTGANSSFSGPVTVNGGTLQIDNGGALGIPNVTGVANGTLILNNAALILNNTNGRLINRPFSFTGVSTISVTANPNPQVGPVLDGVGAGISGANSAGGNVASSNTGGWSGGGTLVLDLRGRQLDIGANNIANPGNGNNGTNVAATFQNFTGTLLFSDANPVGSWTRWAGGVNGFATGNPLATFAFGSGYNNFSFRNGTIQFHIGYISGGTNTVLMGCENADNRTVVYNIGSLPGDQTFAGSIRDYDRQNGAFGVVGFDKESNSSLRLTGIHDYSRPTNVNAGTLIMGVGSNIRGSTTINIANGATLLMNGGTFGGTFGGSGQFMNITGALDVTGAPGYATPPSVTYTGGGSVYGNVNHNVGTMNPGTVGGFGTLTFNNNVTVANSNLSFDVVSGLTNNLGATLNGTTDVLNVVGTNGLSVSGGIVRLNFTGTGSAGLTAGQYYPVVKFNGAVGGAGPSSLLAIALFKGSFLMVQGTGTLANTLGVQVVSPSAPAASITWKPTVADPTDTWDIGGAQNWVPNVGGGQTFYFNQEGITFDDTTTHRNVNVAPTFLAPQFLTVTTNNLYNFSGAGTITGGTSLVKNGSGTLVIENQNNFTGGTTINGGTIIQSLPTGGFLALGPGTIALNGTAGYGFTSTSPNANFAPASGTIVVNGNNTYYMPENQRSQDILQAIMGSGTLTVVKPEHIGGANGALMRGSMSSFTGKIVIAPRLDALQFQLSDEAAGSATGNFGSPSAIFDLGNSNSTLSLGTANRTFDLGGLMGASGFVTGNEYNNTATYGAVGASNTATISVGGANKNTEFGGQVVNANGGALTHFVKVGNSGTQTLTNLQTYTGNTLINGGTLALVNASASPLASPTIIIGTNGVLDVAGLNSGAGGMTLNANQRLISLGNVVGGQVNAVSTSTVGGTKFSDPLFVDDGATVSPGNNGVGTLTVDNLTLNAAEFLVELDATGIDSLVLTGTQFSNIVNAQSNLNLVNIGGFVPGTYTFLDYSGDPSIQGGIEGGFVPKDFAYQVNVIHDEANTRVLLQFVDNSAQWRVNSDGQWSTASNWTMDGTNPAAVVPNSVTFGTFITAPRTVTVNSVIGNTANSMVFNNPNSYTIAGTGTLTLDSGVVAPITVLQGSHSINAPMRALRTLGVSVATGSTLSFGGTIINANNAGINKIGAGTATFTRVSMSGGTMNVGGGKVIFTAKPTNNSVAGTNVLSNLTISPGATVELNNNALILDYTGAIGTRLTDLRAEIADGRLFSSTIPAGQALGYRNNDTGTTNAGGTGTAGLGLGNVANFAGVATDNTSVLIRITYKGDSNLDGIVNVLDLYNLSLNWLSTSGVWAGGDFNFDGIVNQTDLGLLAQNWQQGNGNPLPGEDLGAALTAAGIPLSAVPEPGTLALAGVGAVGLLGRRRRRH